ncbi:MAG: WYL domain-containing protein [Raoultibacter sp.]
MARSVNQKLKMLCLAKMLLEETDDEHGLSMPAIVERLAEQGIAAERKALYRDIALLRDFGLDIITRKGTRTEYAIGVRRFEFQELLLLVDAVQSSRFLTEKKSDLLVDRIKSLASVHQADRLSKRIHVEGRIKMQNESIYRNIDAIQEAIACKQKIEFHYFEYNVNKEEVLRHNGDLYKETPVNLVYAADYYYLIAYNDKHSDFVRYRVDRMRDLAVAPDAATHNEAIAHFDVQDFSLRSCSMFGGKEASVTLLVNREIIGSVIDRFGKDVKVVAAGEGAAHVYVPVLESTVFFGWLAQFGTQVRIEKPAKLAQNYRDYLAEIVATYAP